MVAQVAVVAAMKGGNSGGTRHGRKNGGVWKMSEEV